jgi:hypothetical protein
MPRSAGIVAAGAAFPMSQPDAHVDLFLWERTSFPPSAKNLIPRRIQTRRDRSAEGLSCAPNRGYVYGVLPRLRGRLG